MTGNARLRRAVQGLVLAATSASCVLGPEPVVARNVVDGEYCVSVHAVDFPRSQPRPGIENEPAPTAVSRGFSARALDTARIIGAADEVEQLAAAEAHGAPSAEIVDRRGQINDAIALATLDLASTVAHLQCEEGRAGQMATDLRDAEKEQTRNLTAYSLVATSISAIAAGVIAIADKRDPTPASAVGIGGGVTGGAFGLGTLAVHRTARYRHARNILGEVWSGASHPDIPEIVWAYLTRPQFTKSGTGTVREALVLAWKESGRLGDDPVHPAADRVALYFGEGGTYDADGLDDRSDMLSEVREAVSLLNHELQHLASEAAAR